jgi:DNA-binding CsgD family transcriptional regulator
MSVLQITPAERTALQMLADGLAHHDIARNLCMSECVLNAELKTLFERMGVAGQKEAIADAVRRGVVFTQKRCQEPSERSEHLGDERGANRLGDGRSSLPTGTDLERPDAAARFVAAAGETTQTPGSARTSVCDASVAP